MNQTQKLLQSVVENARTGLDGCEQMLRCVKETSLRDELMAEREQYQAFVRDGERALVDAGARPHAKGVMERMGMWMGVKMNTMTDDSAGHMAEMLIQGLTMGVVGMTRDRNDLPEADPEAHSLAARFVTFQQEAIERLKPMLRKAQPAPAGGK